MGEASSSEPVEWPIPLPRAVAGPSHDVRLLILDVDGVLTDGIILIDDDGRQSKGFHIQDGLAITLWKAMGRQVTILPHPDR